MGRFEKSWAGMGGLPVTQFSCGLDFFYCEQTDLNGVTVSAIPLREPCAVDPSRPTGPEHCVPGQEFRCVVARFQDQTMLVNCDCWNANAGASCQCPAGYDGCVEGVLEYCADGYSLCGCAMTCILL